ncbi:MAG: glycosyltransferase family 39 protein [Phycisphaerae bacterium]
MMIALLAILLIAMMLRMVALQRSHNIAKESTVYLHMAMDFTRQPPREIARSYHYHPGYSGLLAVLATPQRQKNLEEWIDDGSLISLVMSLACLVAIFDISRDTFGPLAAVFATLAAAISGPFIELSVEVLSDVTAAACALGAIALALRMRAAGILGKRTMLIHAAFVGLLAGLAYLTRPEALISAAVGFGVLAWLGKRRIHWKLSLAATLIMLAVLLVCVVPYATTVGGLTAKKGVSDFVGVEQSVLLAEAARPMRLLNAMVKTLDRTRAAIGSPMAFLIIIWVLTWFGRYLLRMRLPKKVLVMPRRRGALVIWLVFGALFVIVTALEYNRGPYISSRHMLIPGLLLASTAGAGLVILGQWLTIIVRRYGKTMRQRRGLSIAALIYVTLALIAAFPAVHEGKRYLRRAGREVLAAAGPNRYVLDPDGRVAFFARAPGRQFRENGGMPNEYWKKHLISTDQLYRLATSRTTAYEVLVVHSDDVEEGPNRSILAELMEDPRFELIEVVGGTRPLDVPAESLPQTVRDKQVWLFRILTPRPS